MHPNTHGSCGDRGAVGAGHGCRVPTAAAGDVYHQPMSRLDATLRALLQAEARYLRARGYTSVLSDGRLWWTAPGPALYGSPGLTQRRAVQIERDKDSSRLRLDDEGI